MNNISHLFPESTMKTWKRPTQVLHTIFLRKLHIDKAFINNLLVYKKFPPYKKEPFYLQLATEFFEVIHMDKKELINLIKKVPIDNKFILDNDIIYINYRKVQEKINGIQVITFYKDQLDHNNKIKLINFYLDEFAIRYLKELRFSENLMIHAYYRWLFKHHIFHWT